MKKYSLLIISLIFLMGILTSGTIHNKFKPKFVDMQTGKESTSISKIFTKATMHDQTLQKDKRNQGSAKILSGKTYVLIIFTGTHQWEKGKVDTVYKQVREAQQWLSQQAKKYGKEVSFVNGSFGDPVPIDLYIESGKASGKESVNYVWQLMKKIGYQSPLNFVKWAKEKEDCDNALVLVIADKEGNSYAITYTDDCDKEKFYLEGAIIYTKFLNRKKPCVASIAHEMCHLFGATDLYANYYQTKENEELARKLYPNDIMLRTSYNINNLVIDEMTAWFIGLTNEEKEWYKRFTLQN